MGKVEPQETRNIFFDLDGTLFPPVGSLRLIQAAKNLYGLDIPIDLTSRTCAGTTEFAVASSVVQQYWPGYQQASVPERHAQAELVIGEMDRVYMNTYGGRPIVPYDGVVELLERLQAYGYALGVVSGNSEVVGEEKLRASDLSRFFNPDRLYWGYFSQATWRKRGFNILYRRGSFPFKWPGIEETDIRHAVCSSRVALHHLAYSFANIRITCKDPFRVETREIIPPICHVADTLNDLLAVVQVIPTVVIPHHFFLRDEGYRRTYLAGQISHRDTSVPVDVARIGPGLTVSRYSECSQIEEILRRLGQLP